MKSNDEEAPLNAEKEETQTQQQKREYVAPEIRAHGDVPVITGGSHDVGAAGHDF